MDNCEQTVVWAYFIVHYKGRTKRFQVDETTKIIFFKHILGNWVYEIPTKLVLLFGDTELEDNYRFDEYGLTGASCTQTHQTELTLMDRCDWEEYGSLVTQLTNL